MLEIINNKWEWLNIKFIKIIDENDFGNLILLNNDKSIWRICPEELQCEKISGSLEEFLEIQKTEEFIEDWNLNFLKTEAIRKFGKLNENEKFTLIKPAVLCGKYELENIIKLPFNKLIEFSADLAFQIKDLQDGQKIIFNINYT